MIRGVDWIERRGLVLLVSIAVYGAATVAFGVSRAFWLTFACLAATGAADTVSMVFRNLIRQIETPDRLRGRMVGVNMVFFMGGPQLGELEAGLVANAMGADGGGRDRRDRLPRRNGLGRGANAGAAGVPAHRGGEGCRRRRGEPKKTLNRRSGIQKAPRVVGRFS